MGHRGVGPGAVPVHLIRRGIDGVTRPNLHGGPVVVLDQAGSVGHVQDLALGVPVPVGAGTGIEPHRQGVERSVVVERSEANRAREVLSGRLLPLDLVARSVLHASVLCRVRRL